MTYLNKTCTYPWYASYVGERNTKIKKLQIVSSISRIWQMYVLSLPALPKQTENELIC